MAQSTEHTAAVKPDIEKLSWYEKQAKSISDALFEKPTVEQRIIELNNKEMDSQESLSEDDQLELAYLNLQRSELAQKDYGLDGPIEKLPTQIIGTLGDVGRSLGRAALTIPDNVRQMAQKGRALAKQVELPGAGEDIAAFTFGAVGALPPVAGPVAFFLDNYNSLRGSMYNELSNLTDDAGKPLDIDPTTKTAISTGVGIVGGAIDLAVGKTIAKATPHLTSFLSPRLAKAVVTDPTKEAIKATLTNIGTSTMAAGGGAAATEITRIVGEEIGKTYDGSEASLLNGLTSAATKVKEYAPRVGEATLAGAAAGLSASAVTGAIGFKKTKSQFAKAEEAAFNQAKDVTPEAAARIEAPQDQVPTPSKPVPSLPDPSSDPMVLKKTWEATKVLDMKEALENMNTVAGETNTRKVAPWEMKAIAQHVFQDTDLKHVFLDVESLRQFTDDEVKAQKVRDLFDPEGLTNLSINAPVKVQMHQFMELVSEYPNALEWARLNPEGPNPKEAAQFIKNLDAADQKRKEILTKLGTSEPTPEDIAAITQALEPVTKDAQVFTEADYLNQPTFTKAIEGVLGEAEVTKYNEAQTNARQSIVGAINEAAKLEMLQVKDAAIEMATEAQYEIETQRLVNDPNLAIVDKFTLPEKSGEFFPTDRRPLKTGTIYELQANHSKPGYSPFAIDPRSLPDKLQKFVDNEQLKKHKVFVKGGITADESARLLGVNGGENLLKIMANTASREDIIKREVTKRSKEISDLADANIDLDKTNIAKAYSNNTYNHLKEMEFMRTKEWPATKAGFKRIALRLPQIEELRLKATNAIAKTKLSDLNINQFKVGEQRSQRVAVESILKNEVEKAFVNKENAALNSELQRATAIAIGKVNRTVKFAKKFNKSEVLQELKDAGPIYENAANEILDHFNLNPKAKGQSEKDSYIKWVKQQVEAGVGNFEIPERLAEIKQSSSEMTVEQYLVAGERLKAILHTAKQKNKLAKKFKEQEIQQTREAVVAYMHDNIVSHPDYNSKNIPKVQETVDRSDIVRGALNTASSLIANMEQIALQLDQENLQGPWRELLVGPIKGTGEFSGYGFANESLDIVAFNKERQKHIDIYGRKDYFDIENTIFEIQEFKDSPGLNNGKLSKGDLMMLMAHGGDPDGYENRKRFGVSEEIIQQVLDKYLNERDAVFMQNAVLNGYKSYQERSAKLQKETTGQDVNFIQGRPFKHKDKVYPGGYLPQKYKIDLDTENAESTLSELKKKSAAIVGLKESKFDARQAAAEMTEQGRFIERTGSDKFLDLSFRQTVTGFEEIIHDLNYRVPTIETLGWLKDPTVRQDIISVVGVQKYRILLNSVIQVASKTQAENSNFFADQNRLVRTILGTFQSGFSVGYLGLNMMSAGIQFASLPFAIQKIGLLNGTKHASNVAYKMSRYPHLLGEFYAHAAELNPSMLRVQENVDDNIIRTTRELLPSKNLFPELKMVDRARKFVVNASMSPIALADQMQRTFVTLTLEQQFLAGDTPNFPLSKLKTMSKDQVTTALKEYVSQVGDLTQTSSFIGNKVAIEKLPAVELFTKFYSDLRNLHGNLSSGFRKSKNKFKQGDYAGAGAVAVSVLVASAMSNLIVDTIRGLRSSEEKTKEKTPLDYAKYVGLSPVDLYADTLPFLKSIKFAAGKETYSDVKNVQEPITKIASDFATTAVAIKDLLTLDDVELSDQQIKSGLLSLSYITGGIPINGAYQLAEMTKAGIEKVESPLKQLNEKINEYLKEKEDEIPPDILEELKRMEAETAPSNPDAAKNAIPANTLDVIKQIESKGKWWAKNSNSTAAGIYQITESTWNGIREQAPELGLTENGRLSSNPEQQEKAMKWLTEQNAITLLVNELDTSVENLYAAHFLGVQTAVKVLGAKGNAKVKSFVSEDTLTKNGLKPSIKVKEFKEWLTNQTESAKQQLTK